MPMCISCQTEQGTNPKSKFGSTLSYSAPGPRQFLTSPVLITTGFLSFCPALPGAQPDLCPNRNLSQKADSPHSKHQLCKGLPRPRS